MKYQLYRINEVFSKKVDGHMQEVLKGAFSALMIRVLGTLIGFIVSVLVARQLGAEGSGVYYLALSVATIAGTLGRVGFDNTVVRFIAAHSSMNEWNDVRYTYRVAVVTTSVASLLLATVLFFSADWLATIVFSKPFVRDALQLSAVAVLPLALSMIHADSLRGLKNIAASQWIKTVLISLGTLALLFPFVRLWGATGAVAAYLASVVLTAVVAGWLWHRALGTRGISALVDATGSLTKGKIFSSSLPLFSVALLGLVIQQAGTISLGIWGTVDEVGIFNVANRLAALLLFPLMAMISILTPKFAAMHRQNNVQGLTRLARSSSRVLTCFAVPVSLGVALSSRFILSLFGQEFSEGYIVLNILLVGVVVNASTGAVAELLMMSGHEKVVSLGLALSALLTILLCLILVPFHGDVGAAIAMASGTSLQNLFMMVQVKHKLGFLPV